MKAKEVIRPAIGIDRIARLERWFRAKEEKKYMDPEDRCGVRLGVVGNKLGSVTIDSALDDLLRSVGF